MTTFTARWIRGVPPIIFREDGTATAPVIAQRLGPRKVKFIALDDDTLTPLTIDFDLVQRYDEATTPEAKAAISAAECNNPLQAAHIYQHVLQAERRRMAGG